MPHNFVKQADGSAMCSLCAGAPGSPDCAPVAAVAEVLMLAPPAEAMLDGSVTFERTPRISVMYCHGCICPYSVFFQLTDKLANNTNQTVAVYWGREYAVAPGEYITSSNGMVDNVPTYVRFNGQPIAYEKKTNPAVGKSYFCCHSNTFKCSEFAPHENECLMRFYAIPDLCLALCCCCTTHNDTGKVYVVGA